MASIEEIIKIRRLTNEPTMTNFDDDAISVILDSNGGDMRSTLAEIWESKAALSANLVDMSEGQSSRKLSQANANALRMASIYRSADDSASGSDGRRSATTRQIVRP